MAAKTLTNPHDVPHWIPALQVTVEPGDTVEVDDNAIAADLVAQGWASPKTTKTNKE